MQSQITKTMVNTNVKKQSLMRTALIDILLLTTACLVPAISHLTALPLYQFNPMLLFLVLGMVMVNDRKNAYLLAVLLPLVSMLIVGMPTPAKALCMGAEYLTVVSLFALLGSKMGSNKKGTFLAMLAAMLGGKVVFYALKAMLLTPVALISTPVMMQVLVMVAFAGLVALIKQN